MIVELISVGTEILLGDIVNTNAQYLSKTCASLGFNLYRQTVVGDNHDRLLKAMAEAAERSDIQILTGGLGSTDDDITKTACIEFLNMPTEEDQFAKKQIFDYFTSDLAREENHKVYTFPKGAELLENKVGTAMGAFIRYKYKGADKIIVILPGPPSEMIPMVENALIDKMTDLIDGITLSHEIKIGILGEYKVNEILKPEIHFWSNPTIAPYVKEDGAMVRLTARAESESKAKELIDKAEQAVYQKLGSFIVAEGGLSRPQCLVELLRKRKERVSTGESITGGMIASTIIDSPGASEVIKESYVVYSDEAKNKILGVSKKTLTEKTAVSYQVCDEMLEGLKRLSKSELNIVSTGYAGPLGPEVGQCFIGIDYKGKKQIEEYKFKGDRAMIRRRARNMAIDRAILLLKEIGE